jgi:hypothetical protein
MSMQLDPILSQFQHFTPYLFGNYFNIIIMSMPTSPRIFRFPNNNFVSVYLLPNFLHLLRILFSFITPVIFDKQSILSLLSV